MSESSQSRIDALVRTAAAIEMELQATQEELERVIRRYNVPSVAKLVLEQSHARIAAKLANPDEGVSGRMH